MELLLRSLQVATEHGLQLATLMTNYETQILDLRTSVEQMMYQDPKPIVGDDADHTAEVLIDTECIAGAGPVKESLSPDLRPLMRAPIVADPAETEMPRASLRLSSDDVQAGLRDAIISDNDIALKRMLDKRADPNVREKELQVKGMAYDFCSPLALAALRADFKIVKLLLQAKADPSSEYAFKAGALQADLCFPAFFAIVPSGNCKLLQSMVECRADVGHVAACNNSNLLWQAAYNGHASIVQYCADQGLDLEIRTINQDKRGATHTPLHIAARAGHKAVVSLLIDRDANIFVDDGSKQSVMDDAVANSHADVVKLLIKHSAQIIDDGSMCMARTSTGSSLENRRVLDNIFETANPILIASIAEGLRYAPVQVEHLSAIDVARFLRTPGKSAVHILRAIFQRREINYWDSNRKRKFLRTGAVTLTLPQKKADGLIGTYNMNVAMGPHYYTLRNMYLSKVPPDGMTEEFFRSLVNLENVTGWFRQSQYTQVQLLFCPLQDVACLEVVMAIADYEGDELYAVPGCQAILHSVWPMARKHMIAEVVTTLLNVLALTLITSRLPDVNFGPEETSIEVKGPGGGRLATTTTTITTTQEPGSALDKRRLSAFAYFGFLLVAIEVLLEVAQLIGYSVCGLVKRYLADIGNYLDYFRLLMLGFIFLAIPLTDCAIVEVPLYNVTVTGAIIFMWGRVALASRAIRGLGLMVLPIIFAVMDCVPFLIILAFSFVAAAHAYLTLVGVEDIRDTIFKIWRAGMFGEHSGLDNGREVEDIPQFELPQNWRNVLHMFFMLLTFFVSITLLNIFIAVLGKSYQDAYNRAWLAFMRQRCHLSAQALAMKESSSSLKLMHRHYTGKDTVSPKERISAGLASEAFAPEDMRSKTGKKLKTQTSAEIHETSGSEGDSSSAEYVWVCVPMDEDTEE